MPRWLCFHCHMLLVASACRNCNDQQKLQYLGTQPGLQHPKSAQSALLTRVPCCRCTLSTWIATETLLST